MISKINRLSLKLFNKNLPGFSLPSPDSTELLNINEIKKAFEKLPKEDTTDLDGAALEWTKHMNELRYLILNRDPREFLSWKVIRFTMFLEYADYLIEELNYLRTLTNFTEKWEPALKESSFGQPKPYAYFESTSGSLLHHAYHLARFEERAEIAVNDYDFIFEFGGGYGSMGRLLQNIGYKKKYLIFDLPHFSALQSYYLKSLGYNVLNKAEFMNEESGIICISDLIDLRDIIESMNLSERKVLFVGTWSLSETPLTVRKDINKLLPKTSHFLIGYQHYFEEVDNLEYFSLFQEKYTHLTWESTEITHMPGSSYLFGF